MTKNVILNALDNMGFSVEELSDHYFSFEYEGVNYLYTTNDDDENFFLLSIPAIFQLTEENEEMVLHVVNQTNNIVKYVKIICMHEMVWAVFEYPLFEWVDIEDMLEFAIKGLQSAALVFNSVLRGEFDSDFDEEEEDKSDNL